MRGCLLATRPPRPLSWNFISLPSTFVLTNFLCPPSARYQEIPISIWVHLHPLLETTSLPPFLYFPLYFFLPLLLHFLPPPPLLFLLLDLLPLPLLLLFSRAPSDLLAFSSCFFQSQTLVVGTYLLEATRTHTLAGCILFTFSSVVLRQWWTTYVLERFT